jgi:hypothetical protein
MDGSGGGGAGYIAFGQQQGTGAGGGGSGTFIYTPDGYFAVAGGGGGGGGAGGSTGKGGAGGKGGDATGTTYPTGSSGGFGGGGPVLFTDNNSIFPYASPYPNTGLGAPGHKGYGGDDGAAGEIALCSVHTIPDDWKNTNSANGWGANGVRDDGNGLPGAAGGNNRNATRGGGSPGGTPGLPYDGIGSAGGQGGTGAVAIYKIF